MEVSAKEKINLCLNQRNSFYMQAVADAEAYTGFSDYIKVNPATNPIIYVKAA